METQTIWNNYNQELYFFILKKVKSKNAANDVFQNTFLKIHLNLTSLKNVEKTRAWVFQIARNEIINYFNNETVYTDEIDKKNDILLQQYQHICCFDKFINELPKIYKEVIELVYIKGHQQKEVAVTLDISLENVKARIRRAKEILKKRFNECCKYELDKNGHLTGESNCSICEK